MGAGETAGRGLPYFGLDDWATPVQASTGILARGMSMKLQSLVIVAAVHLMLSFVVFIKLMAIGLRAPDAPAEPWHDAAAWATFWLLFFPSIALQQVGIDLWKLAILVIVPNTALWIGALLVVMHTGRIFFRTLKGR